GQVTAIGGTGQDTYAFYGSKAGLQVDLTIEHFKAGDKIDISQLLSSPIPDDYLSNYLTAPGTVTTSVDSHNNKVTTVHLTNLAHDNPASIDLTIIGTANQVITPISSDFVTTHPAGDDWVNHLNPLVYPNV
ncbi:type I secretion C-terminal target domain-containing protein, partial [Polynucleobacter paneuropaeus]|nr:type I secretion C-terminal target domain-containing protein [Polynucleobacter paneuropaeus]